MKLDSAVAKLLALDNGPNTSVSHVGGGMSSASASKIASTSPNGSSRNYFMKIGSGSDAEIMFKGEHASLNAMHNAVSSLCPASYGHGRLADSSSKYFLVTDFLDISGRRAGGTGSGTMTLAQKMAKLHTTTAPIPEGHDKPMFGLLVVQKHMLLAQSHPTRAGNAARGSIGGRKEVEDIVFDPSASYAHSEFDLGIMNVSAVSSSNCDPIIDESFMKMFGGFGSSFFNEYHELCPKTEPAAEYDDRIALYELYHHLNHHSLFGGGYRSGAVCKRRLSSWVEAKTTMLTGLFSNNGALGGQIR
ncbi:MAG: hypothetical protein Q9159_003969 [Coniocarpon cinnabarinum]